MPEGGATKNLSELRVVDLRAELEKRGLEKNGVKAALMERLAQALKSEGLDPETHKFDLNRRSSTTREDVDSKESGDTSTTADAVKSEETKVEEVKVQEVKVEEVKVEDTKTEKTDEKPNNTEVDDSLILLAEDELEDGPEKVVAIKVEEKETDESNPTHPSKIDDDPPTESDDTRPTSDQLSNGGDQSIKKEEDTPKTEEDTPKTEEDSENKIDLKPTEEPTTDNSGKEAPPPEGSPEENDSAPVPAKKSDKELGRSLWITGLSSKTRATDLKQLLSKYGKVIGAKIVANPRSPSSVCYGYVVMASVADADTCVLKCKGLELHGRTIRVDKGRQIDRSSDRKSRSPRRGDRHPDKRYEDSRDRRQRRSPQRPSRRSDQNRRRSRSPRKSKSATKDVKKSDKKEETKKEDEKDLKKESGTDLKKEDEKGVKKEDEKDVKKEDDTEDVKEEIGDMKESKSKKDEDAKDDDAKSTKAKSRAGSVHSKKSTNSKRSKGRSSSRRKSNDGDVLSFRQIVEDRDRHQRHLLRERQQRKLQREEQLRVRELERRNKKEATRLERERERLRMEREMLQSEKSNLLRLERRMVQIQQMDIQKKLEDSRRKRSNEERRDPYVEHERKRAMMASRYDVPRPPVNYPRGSDLNKKHMGAYKNDIDKSRMDMRMQRDAREDIRAARNERDKIRLKEDMIVLEELHERGYFAPPPPRLSGTSSVRMKYNESGRPFPTDDPRVHEMIRRGEPMPASMSNRGGSGNMSKDVRYVERMGHGHPQTHEGMPNTYRAVNDMDPRRAMGNVEHGHRSGHHGYDMKEYDRPRVNSGHWHNSQQMGKQFSSSMENESSRGGGGGDSKNPWMKVDNSQMMWQQSSRGEMESGHNSGRYDRRHMERR